MASSLQQRLLLDFQTRFTELGIEKCTLSTPKKILDFAVLLILAGGLVVASVASLLQFQAGT